jgi:small subunit ribosomal protein S1
MSSTPPSDRAPDSRQASPVARHKRQTDPLKSEIEEALDGVDLQALERSPAAGARGSRDSGKLWMGVVAGVSGDDVFVELGPRSQGVCARKEFETEPAIGQRFEFSAHGQEEGLWLLSRREAQALAAWDQISVGARVQARVTGQNTGGLELKLGPLAAFLPASQVSLTREEDLARYIGQSLECQVIEIDSARKRVLLSRRAVLEQEREGARKDKLGSLASGQSVRGKVMRIEPFGAFVELGGGIEGLLHVSNLSRRRVNDPNEVLKVGQEVQVLILEIKENGKRIGLGMKQLKADPWQDIGSRYAVDQVLAAKVNRLTEFGAFLELEPGVDGLLHVSQIGRERVRRAHDVLSVGQELSVRILAIEPARQRISLTRLDPRGAVIGSEDAVESSVIEDVIQRTNQTGQSGAGTNLGRLFKRALDGKS